MTQQSAHKSKQLRLRAAELTNLANWLEADAPQTHEALSEQLLLGFRWDELELDVLLSAARKEYQDRQRRKLLLPSDLLGEPGWDILLDLFIAKLEWRSISVTSACVASDVPQTTALRWLGLLEEHGLVERVSSAEDKRVTYIQITDQSASIMTNLIKNKYDFLFKKYETKTQFMIK